MRKECGYPTLEVIYKASAGNETSIKEILKFYDAYTCKLCLRLFYHSESGKIAMQVDEELKGQIHTEMMKAILKFEIRVKSSYYMNEKREIHRCFVLSPMLFLMSYQGSFNRGKFVVKWEVLYFKILESIVSPRPKGHTLHACTKKYGLLPPTSIW